MPETNLLPDDDSLPSGLGVTPSCPPLSLLRASREGALPPELANDVAGHIESCSLCRTLLADLDHIPQPALTAAERNRIRRKLPLPPAQKTTWPWYVASAAAVALIITGITLFVRQPAPAIATQPVTHSQPMPSTPQPAPQPAAPPIEVAKLAPPTALSPGLVLRGGEASTAQPSAQQLDPAFTAYTQGDYPLAEQRFNLLAAQYPRSETLFLYLGVTQLLQNNIQAALPSLSRADSLARENHSPQRDAATWYHALAATTAQAPDAGTLLDNVCLQTQSPYSRQACQLRSSRK